ncbi:hypothetical protein E2C01_013497 [Portunus trituberculatus]|uniref:Uncharacterized protein n=1 Tax=Portunus trituberculatus TaxID=210409 RepID=A0A5B7DHF9_PORTR|nr:hypothetical protein [Portunus trituberculatus]
MRVASCRCVEGAPEDGAGLDALHDCWKRRRSIQITVKYLTTGAAGGAGHGWTRVLLHARDEVPTQRPPEDD